MKTALRSFAPCWRAIAASKDSGGRYGTVVEVAVLAVHFDLRHVFLGTEV
jgi:hypothetical protein